MTFLEALNWMNESEKNITLAPNGCKYLIKDGYLHYLGGADGKTPISTGTIPNKMDFSGWEKTETDPKEKIKKVQEATIACLEAVYPVVHKNCGVWHSDQCKAIYKAIKQLKE